jgi:outer membrane protein assembly factor BamD
MGLDQGRALRRRIVLLVALLAAGCASSEPDIATLASNSDQVIWEAGQKAVEKKQWESARRHFKRIIEGFPQSQYSAAARLALADSHFKEGSDANYILAVSEYRDYLTLYPSLPQSDYAQFHIGEAYYLQKNGPDRDQSPTEKALEEYQRLLDVYPKSQYGEAARARIAECRASLARAEFLAGYFYQKTRKAYRAAISRYEGILNDYVDYAQIDEVMYRLAQCLALTGRPGEALPRLATLLERYPDGKWAADARALMDEIKQEKFKGLPSAPASPAPAAQPTPSPQGTPGGP